MTPKGTWTLSIRLIVYMLCFMTLLSGVILGTATLLNRFSIVNEKTKSMLETHLMIYEQDIVNYFDHYGGAWHTVI